MPICAVTNYNPNYKTDRKLDNLAKIEKVRWPYSTPWLIETAMYAYYRSMDIPFDVPVFNAGVLIMNLACLRKHGTLTDALGFLLQNPEKCPCLDQDALNYVIKGHYFALKPKWNDATIKHYGVMSNYSIDDLRDAYNCPSIVHFVGGTKPWTYACVSPYKKIYWKYRKQTPWDKKEYKDKNLRKIILHFFRFVFGIRFTDGFIFRLMKKMSKS
jgi:lipopolysaccharide biosynthesis glycosyltransferase